MSPSPRRVPHNHEFPGFGQGNSLLTWRAFPFFLFPGAIQGVPWNTESQTTPSVQGLALSLLTISRNSIRMWVLKSDIISSLLFFFLPPSFSFLPFLSLKVNPWHTQVFVSGSRVLGCMLHTAVTGILTQTQDCVFLCLQIILPHSLSCSCSLAPLPDCHSEHLLGPCLLPLPLFHLLVSDSLGFLLVLSRSFALSLAASRSPCPPELHPQGSDSQLSFTIQMHTISE